MIKNLKLILDKNDLHKIILIFFLNCIVAILELCSIGSIPLLANLVVNFENFIATIPFENLKFFLSLYTLNEIVIFSFLFVVVIFFVKNITLFFIIFFEQKFYKGLNFKLSKTFFNHYINSKYEFHAKNKPSDLASNIDNEIEYSVAYINYFGLLLRDLLVVTVLTLLLLYINFKVTFSILIVFSITLFIFYFLVRGRLKTKSEKNVGLREEIIKLLNESFGSIKELKVYKKTEFIQKIFEKKAYEFQKNNLFFHITSKSPRLIFEVVAITFLLIIFLYVFITLNSDYKSFIPTISLLVVTFVRFIPAFNSITTSLGMIKIFAPSLKKVSVEMEKMTNNRDLKDDKDVFFQQKQNKDEFIEFEDVSFKYTGNNTNTINNLSLKINNQDHIGIIGSTGAGKSTFINLLLGLLKPSSGLVRINSKKEKKLNIGYVSQNVFLLNTTIKENIFFNLGENPSHSIKNQFYQETLELTNLKKFISDCKYKDNTIIGDNGMNVSGGQKQRIAIARAIINQPDILILDEATNALDYKTENLIMSNLSKYFSNKILIIIGHRPGSLKRCNKIYQMEEGRLNVVKDYKYFNSIN